MLESLIQIEIYRENDVFHGKLSTFAGIKEYENVDYDELIEDMFRELQEEIE